MIIGAGFALNYFARTVPALAACILLFTLGEMVTMPMASAYIANLAPAHMRGRYLGVSALTWSVALIIGPGLGMKLFGSIRRCIGWRAAPPVWSPQASSSSPPSRSPA